MKKSILAAFAMIVLLTNLASAQPAGGGPGGTGGRGMGPHMMDGYGMGPGMMGNYGMGMGFGMMCGCGPGSLVGNLPDLTNEQRTKISDIQKEFRRKQWGLMEKMHEDMQSGNFYRSGKFDEQAARKAYDQVASIHKQMFENSIEAHKRIDGVLTPQQREQLQRMSGGR